MFQEKESLESKNETFIRTQIFPSVFLDLSLARKFSVFCLSIYYLSLSCFSLKIWTTIPKNMIVPFLALRIFSSIKSCIFLSISFMVCFLFSLKECCFLSLIIVYISSFNFWIYFLSLNSWSLFTCEIMVFFPFLWSSIICLSLSFSTSWKRYILWFILL